MKQTKTSYLATTRITYNQFSFEDSSVICCGSTILEAIKDAEDHEFKKYPEARFIRVIQLETQEELKKRMFEEINMKGGVN